MLFIVLAGCWCYSRNRSLVYILPIGLLTILYSLIHGYAHHHGTLLIAAIAAMWIAWPSPDQEMEFNKKQRAAHIGICGLILCLCVVNIWDAEVAIRHEYAYPYSGAEDAAKYLKSVGADRQKILGFLYGVVGVEAFFDRNILVNMPTAYFHQGLPFHGLELDLPTFRQFDPDYVVLFTEQPQLSAEYGIPELRAQGYQIVHMSDGYMIYKQGVYVRQFYFILRRTESSAP